MAASSNPFTTDSDDDDDAPNFSNSRVVIDDPSYHSLLLGSKDFVVVTLEAPERPFIVLGYVFDLTEFPASFDEHLSLRRDDAVVETAVNAGVSYEEAETRRNSEDNEEERLRVVVTQPRVSDERPPRPHRRQIPVYTLGWSSTREAQFMAATGLDFLTGVHEILLQQTISNWPAEKRYLIKVPNGETLYATSENSTQLERTCCGSQRGFVMSLLDHTQQEAATFTKGVGCALSWFPCILQNLKVYMPGGELVGSVRQDLSLSSNSFTITDKNGSSLYRIFGPDICSWIMPLDATFSLVGGDGGGRLGVISRKWNNALGDYHLHLTFPAPGLADHQKLLILGAAFLIEYMYFEHRRTGALRIC